MSNMEQAIAALESSNEATAFLMVADAAFEADWEEAAELSELATTIVGEEDMAVASMAAAVFLQILENKRCGIK